MDPQAPIQEQQTREDLKEDAILSSLKAEESRISKEENKIEGHGRIVKGGPAAAAQGAFNKFSAAVAEERGVALPEVMSSTPAEPLLTTAQLRQALREEVEEPQLHPPSVAAKIQSAQAKYEYAIEQLEVRNRHKPTLTYGILNPQFEDETLAMLRAVTEQIMIDEIESRNKEQVVPGIDIRIFRGSAAAKAQGAFSKYAQALAIERGVHEAEVEAAAAFYSPIPKIEDVIARLENEAERRSSYETSQRSRVEPGSPASKVTSAARKLEAAAAKLVPSVRGGIPGASQLLKGDQPVFVLGVTPGRQNETLSLLKRDAADRQSALTRRAGGTTPSPSSAASAEVALNKYATGLSLLRNIPVPEILRSVPSATDVEISVNPPIEILNRLRHEAIVLLVEERRAGTKNVEKGSAASYIQSAVGHYGTSLRMRMQEDAPEATSLPKARMEETPSVSGTTEVSTDPTNVQEIKMEEAPSVSKTTELSTEPTNVPEANM